MRLSFTQTIEHTQYFAILAFTDSWEGYKKTKNLLLVEMEKP